MSVPHQEFPGIKQVLIARRDALRERHRRVELDLQRRTGEVLPRRAGTVGRKLQQLRRALVFRRDQPGQLVYDVLKDHEDELGIALARSFAPFRTPFAKRVIQRISRENALFSLATALPDVIPSIFELPWAVTEFASDTAVLTANQVRMAFLLAAASDRETGYREQKREIASVIGGAFGWRALARQLIGKIPFGGGLIPKAAIAYAGTKLVGVSLERYYRIGYTYTREERNQIYTQAFEHGKGVVSQILRRVRPDLWEKHAAKMG